MAPLTVTILGAGPAAPNAGGACSGYLVQDDGRSVRPNVGAGELERARDHVGAARQRCICEVGEASGHCKGTASADHQNALIVENYRSGRREVVAVLDREAARSRVRREIDQGVVIAWCLIRVAQPDT